MTMTYEKLTWAEATEKLLHACQTNSIAEAEFAIKSHANLFHVDENGNGPLHIAALHDSDKVINLLTSPEVGIDINMPNAQNMTALHLASHRNALKSVKTIANNPHTDFSLAYDTHKKHTAQYDAAFDQHTEAVHLI